MNRLTNLVYTTGGNVLLAQYQYAPRADGKWQTATEILRQVNGSYATNQIAWNYDNLGRLVLEKWTSTSLALNFTNAYVLNLVGNRLWKTNISGAGTDITSYTYNTNDQLLVENSTVSGSFTNWYDLNGSLTNRTSAVETNAYAYNLQNRLASATIKRLEGGVQLSETINFTSDYKGNRVRADWSRSINGGASTNGTNIFINEPNGPGGLVQVLEELPTVGASPTVSYVLGGRIISQGKAGVVSHFLPDGHGSTRQLADTNGAITAKYSFDAYGKAVDFTNFVQTPSATGILYSGEKRDVDLQQDFLRARYYLPGLGRFNQIDPFSGNQQNGANRYAYCQADPVNNSDPSGLYELDVHRYMTEYIARQVGFPENRSIELGQGTQMPDDDNRDALHGLDTWANMRRYHFVSQERLAGLTFFIANDQQFALDAGTFLHAQEDTYSHATGIGERDWNYYGNLFVFPNGIPFGHVLQGHRPDHTWWDSRKAMRMAWRVYQDLRHMRGHNNSYPDPWLAVADTPTDEADPGWSGMRADLQRFMDFRPNVYNPLTELGVERVTRQGMLQKIHLLLPGVNEAAMDDQDRRDIRRFRDVVGHAPGVYPIIPAHGAQGLTIGPLTE